MKAAVLHEVGKPLVVEDLQVDDLGPREVLVRTVAAGVCHGDYIRWKCVGGLHERVLQEGLTPGARVLQSSASPQQ